MHWIMTATVQTVTQALNLTTTFHNDLSKAMKSQSMPVVRHLIVLPQLQLMSTGQIASQIEVKVEVGVEIEVEVAAEDLLKARAQLSQYVHQVLCYVEKNKFAWKLEPPSECAGRSKISFEPVQVSQQ